MTQTSDYDVEETRVLSAPPDRVYQAFVDPNQFVRWYGPDGFPVDPATIEVDPRVGGRQRFDMVSEADPSMRTGFDGRFIEVVENALLASTGAWDGIRGQSGPWPSGLRIELHDEGWQDTGGIAGGAAPAGDGRHGTASLGRDAPQAGVAHQLTEDINERRLHGDVRAYPRRRRQRMALAPRGARAR